MLKTLLMVGAGVLACIGFSLLFEKILDANGANWFSSQGPVIFVAGVLVAILFKKNK